jgi:GT2 family glycosyltransferase
MNNDTEVLSADWLDVLGAASMEEGAGAVGPLLVDARGRVQHAGIVTGPGGIAEHVHAGLRPDECDPAVPLVRRDVSAVTGACLVVEKRKFVETGGFDDRGLAVAFNDVDLCLRLEGRGYRNIFVPEITLLHHGSATREADDFTTGSDRFREEFKLMRSRWGARLDADPYLPHHMQLLSSVPRLRLA